MYGRILYLNFIGSLVAQGILIFASPIYKSQNPYHRHPDIAKILNGLLPGVLCPVTITLRRPQARRNQRLNCQPEDRKTDHEKSFMVCNHPSVPGPEGCGAKGRRHKIGVIKKEESL
jgi:hypothetical protein